MARLDGIVERWLAGARGARPVTSPPPVTCATFWASTVDTRS